LDSPVNPLASGSGQFAAMYALQFLTGDMPQESSTETTAANTPLLNFSMPAQGQAPASKAGGKKQSSDTSLPDAASRGTLGVAVALVPAITPQVISQSPAETPQSGPKAISEIGVESGRASNFGNAVSGNGSFPSPATFSAETILPVDSVLSQTMVPASSGLAARMVNSQNASSQNSAATTLGMVRSAQTPLASRGLEQTRTASADDPTNQVEAQDSVPSALLVNEFGQLGSAAEPAKPPAISAEFISSAGAPPAMGLPTEPPALGPSNLPQTDVTDSIDTRSVPSPQSGSARIAEFQVPPSTESASSVEPTDSSPQIDQPDMPTAAGGETPAPSSDADPQISALTEAQPAIGGVNHQDFGVTLVSAAAQNKPSPAASAVKAALVNSSSPSSPISVSAKISEGVLAAARVEDFSLVLITPASANEPAHNTLIAQASSLPALHSSPGILVSSAPNSTQTLTPNSSRNSDVSADPSATKPTNSAGQTSDKTAWAQSSPTAPAKPAPGKADSDNGNSSASSIPDASTAPASAVAPAPIATAPTSIPTAAPTSAAPPQEGSPQNSPSPAPPSPESNHNLSAGQAGMPVPTDSPAMHAGPVQLAQMVNKAAQSEMRVELNTSAFGSVEVRTTVRANDVGVLIGSEKGDLRSLLANELPGIASNLQQQNLRLNQVNFHQGFASANQMSSGGDGSQSRSFAPRTGGTMIPLDISLAESSEPEEADVPSSNRGRLSILA
jgi:hypothetical protein